MKQTFFLFVTVSLMVCLTSCNGKRKIFSDNEIQRSYRIGEFEKIELKTIGNVHYSQADTTSLRIVGPERAIKDIAVKIEGGVLKIDYTRRSELFNIRDREDIDIYVTSPDLTAIDVCGSGDVEVEGHLDTDMLTLMLRGAGDIDIDNMICDTLNVTLLGAGSIEVGSVDCQSSAITLKGVGDVEVNYAACDYVWCSLMGVGNVELSGNVGRLEKEVRGAGSIDIEKLKTGK